jgi:predicted MFS family arabinose efflux permease
VANETASTASEGTGLSAEPMRGFPQRKIIISVAVVFLIVLFSSAIKNSLTAFLVPMGNSFGESRGSFAAAPSLFMVTYAVMSPVVGYFADRLGGKRTMLSGLAIGAVLFFLGGLSHQFPIFVALYGVGLAVAYTAVSYVPLGVLVNELFAKQHRGIMYALLTNGAAVGFIVLSPLWISLSTTTSWRTVYLWLGAVFLVLLALAVYLVPGRDMAPELAVSSEPAMPLGTRLRLVLRNRGFWIVAGPFFACGTSMAFIDVNMVADMHDHHISSGMISVSMVLLGATEICGAMAAGYMADRGRQRLVLVGSYAVRAVALLTLLVMPGVIGSMAFAILFGVSYMGTVIASSVALLELFDNNTRGLALGLLWLVHQAGSSVSAQGGALSYDHFHSYDTAIAAIAGSVALAALVASLFSPASRPPAKVSA